MKRLWEYDPFLSPRSLRQGLYSVGEPSRMRRFVHKLLSGVSRIAWFPCLPAVAVPVLESRAAARRGICHQKLAAPPLLCCRRARLRVSSGRVGDGRAGSPPW